MFGTRRGTWAAIAICALVHVLTPHRSLAQADHRLVWRSLQTPHFHIHYHEPLGILARQLASRAETINARIGAALGLELHQTVHVVLADDDDAANGFASVLPYNAIHLRVVAPEDMSPLSDYDDWLSMLLTHEHTHIVHLEQASGLPRLLTALLGRFYTPQGSLPGWFVEGLAVVEESAHTTAGRVRSPMFEMYLRMASLEQRLLGIDWIGFDGEPWPHGNVRYLYGQAFLQFVVNRYGQRAMGRFIEQYGKRLVPYGLNRALKRATGRTFTELYGEFLAELNERSDAERRRVEQEGRREGVRLTQHGELTRSPRFLSNGELVYSVSDARHVPQIARISLDSPLDRDVLAEVATVAQVARVPGDDAIVYSSVEYHRGVYAYDELSRINGRGRHRRRLSRALRAREPDVSPDGKQVVYVTHGAGTSHLEIAELSDLEHSRRMLVRSRRLEQVFTPRWSQDGKRIAYSAWSRGGFRDIWVLDVASGTRTRVTYDRALDRGPVFSPNGELLYFSSDRSGIANLYAYQFATGKLTQITNVVGGAFQPDVSPDGRTIVYVGYGSRGFDLYALSLEDAAQRPAELPRTLEPIAYAPSISAQVTQSEPYRPYRTLYPRYYEFASDEGNHGRRLSISSSGGDVVGWHSWTLQAYQGIEQTNEHSLQVGYAYRRPRFPLLLRASLGEQPRDDLVINNRKQTWDAVSWGFAVGTNFVFPRPLKTLSLRAEYSLGMLQGDTSVGPRLDPNYPPPHFPPTGLDTRANFSLTHSSAQRQPFDISDSWGHVATVATSVRDPAFGSRTRDQGLSWRWEQYVRFGFRESVLAWAYTGAWDTQVSLGGYPAQLVPLFDYVTGSRGAPADYARLRGYPLRAGDQLQVVQLEYRFLITRINRGVETLPIFARRLHAALFVDAGDAYKGRFVPGNLGVGTGAELRLDWAAAYGVNYTLRGGIAVGMTRGGEPQWYTTIARPF
ncbi:MAG: hypothetical protein QM778_11305 [Myxococcales bacterium]